MPRQPLRRKAAERTINGEYRSAVLTYLYLESKTRSIAISKLPPDMLEYFGCVPRHIGKRGVTFDVQIPRGTNNGEVERRIKKIGVICSHRQNRHLFYREVERKKYTMSDFFRQHKLLVKKGSRNAVKEGWYGDNDLALEAVRFLYGKVLGKDLKEKPPERKDFTLRGLKGLLDDAFKGDPEAAVKQAGLVPQDLKQQPTDT
jgi:hypothetical protein